ncbi:hypothetical protein QBC34DRAFT_429690 [Podospora aff. communis PSN243]|uniref:Uncharacterized protein n=1 Tax=Podospora aff. communis PSN243 TaxID=3040156 RepID=A0AAV9G895_9PEZI|nr:hypothetical protein QBC34DRAFT_429690 [Podospora aff. communis PSN243]
MSSLSLEGDAQAQPITINIWIESVKLLGTSINLLKHRKLHQVTALCANHTQGPNEVTPAALRPFLEPQISDFLLSQWAQKEDLIAVVKWRSEPNGVAVETHHKISRTSPPSHSHEVVFEGNLDCVSRATSHIANFTRTTEATMAAMAASRYRDSYSPMSSAYLPNWYGSPTSDSEVFPPLSVTETTRRPTRRQDQFHIHNTGLVERYQRYADEKYRSTGDATDVLRAMELSAKVAASQLR